MGQNFLLSILSDQLRGMNQIIGYLIEYDINTEYDMGVGQNPIIINWNGMNIHKSHLFLGSLSTRLLTHSHIINDIAISTAWSSSRQRLGRQELGSHRLVGCGDDVRRIGMGQR